MGLNQRVLTAMCAMRAAAARMVSRETSWSAMHQLSDRRVTFRTNRKTRTQRGCGVRSLNHKLELVLEFSSSRTTTVPAISRVRPAFLVCQHRDKLEDEPPQVRKPERNQNPV